MASTLEVIVRREDYDEMSLEDIFDSLVNEDLFAAYPQEFDYFTTDFDNEDEESFFGADKPDKMKTFASTFNKRIDAIIDVYDERVRDYMAKNGIKKLSEVKDDLLLWNLRQSLCPKTGRFTYGCGLLYKSDQEWRTYLLEKDIEEMTANPEKFAVITCFYH